MQRHRQVEKIWKDVPHFRTAKPQYATVPGSLDIPRPPMQPVSEAESGDSRYAAAENAGHRV
jgi:hypothetical protein